MTNEPQRTSAGRLNNNFMAKVLGKVPLRLKQALAFHTKFPFLFSKLTFHFTIIIIFPKKTVRLGVLS